jgi:hypothetical protein
LGLNNDDVIGHSPPVSFLRTEKWRSSVSIEKNCSACMSARPSEIAIYVVFSANIHLFNGSVNHVYTVCFVHTYITVALVNRSKIHLHACQFQKNEIYLDFSMSERKSKSDPASPSFSQRIVDMLLKSCVFAVNTSSAFPVQRFLPQNITKHTLRNFQLNSTSYSRKRRT